MRFIMTSLALVLSACAVNPVEVSPSSGISSHLCKSAGAYVAAVGNRASVMDLSTSATFAASILALQHRRDAVIAGLPQDVRDDKVVKSVLNLMITRKAESSNSISLMLASRDTVENAGITTLISQSKPDKLYAGDFENLYKKLISPKGAAHSSRVIAYETAYFKGQFTDRFGTTLTKPTLALTITDQEISAVLTTFLEALADDLFSTTPVWKDANNNYYPGDNTSEPTFLTFPGAPAAVLLVDSGCGMTKLKSDALAYLSGKASTWAAGGTGFVLGSLGGVAGGPVLVWGKLSIGDNKTLQTVAQTMLAGAAKRATFEALKDVLINIDQPAGWTLGDLIDSLVFGKT
jgi:hypothetical protein